MYELFRQLMLQLHGMWRYRWQALLLAWVVSIGIWIFVYSLPDEYEGSARVFIDTESVLKPLLKGLAVETDVMTEVNMITQALLSRPNLEKIIRETDMDHRAKTPREMSELIKRLKRKIKIHEGYGNLYTIKYRDIDRKMAGKVVQNLLNSMVEDTLGANRTDTTTAQRFLRTQIKEYEQHLVESEQRLADFKKEHVGQMPTDGEDYYTRLQKAMEELEYIDSELTTARNRGNEIRRQLAGEVPAYFGFKGPATRSATSEDDEQIQKYRAQLDQLSLKFTDDHPDIVILKETLAQLVAKRNEKLAALGGVKPDLQQNPAYQRMRSALSEVDVNIAILQGQRDEQKRKVDKLRKLVDTIPEVEAQLTRLNRDYEVTKGQYEAMLQRLESARLSEQAEESNDDIKFRIIDPVNVPPESAGLSRTLYLFLALIAGVSSGLGLALLLAQMRPVFLDRDRLRESMSLPILGSVSMVFTHAQEIKLRVEVISLVGGASLLLVAAGGVIVFQGGGVRVTRSLLGLM